jgi:glycosyltransferase involved in cell wall biosynthesis
VLLPIYGAFFYGPFLRRADRVICLTDTMRDEVARTFAVPSQRIAVVPNGVDTDLFRPGEPSLRAERELLMVGRLTAQKNVLLVLEAMRLLPRDITLRMVGDGDLRDEVARQITVHGLANVRLEGRLRQNELAVAYRRATAVLMPSSHEGLPLVLLEALSSGAPVICSALPELVEAGGDAVVTVDPLTAAGLAAAIENLLGDRARRRRLSETASRHAAGFGWPAVATAVDKVYQQVRTGARDRPPGPGD